MSKIVRRNRPEEAASIQADQNPTPPPLPVPTFDLASVNRLLQLRRSIFPVDYSDEPVSKEELEQLLQNAHWAPNHGHTEPWHFVVFHGKEALIEFGEAHAELYRKHTPEETFVEKKFNKLQGKPKKAAAIIAICMKRGSNPKIPEIEEVEAVACAVHNMHLTATAMGLGGYWSSGGMTYHASMQEFLGLGPEDRCLGFFFLGRPKSGWKQGRRKTNWEDKVEWR
ncbi:MAG: nitroreductase [Bacteroidota bacterium]